MKFIRLQIKNYRGVTLSTIPFAPTGATLIQGPNEAGKTSLAESIHLLFQHKASSQNREIREIKPVHRDANTEIELEAQSGPYHFIYKKQFHKAKATELQILTPTPENLTDDEAHDRANKILAETLDKPLWDALIVRQGDMISQPDLSGKTALMQALDGETAGAHDRQAETLFERVETEYAKHYQKNSRESADFAQTIKRLETATAHTTDSKSLLDSLEKKIAHSATLKRRIADLQTQTSAKKTDLEKNRRIADEIDETEKDLAAARLAQKTAEAAERDLHHAAAERHRLAAAAAQAKENAEKLDAELRQLTPLHAEADARASGADDELTRLESAKKEVDAALALARNDFDHLNDRLHLEMMRERKARLTEASESAKTARETLTNCRIDDKTPEQIRKAELAVAGLQAQLEAESPKVALRPLADIEIVVAGEKLTLKPGDIVERSAAGPLDLTVPNRFEIRVAPGGSLDELNETLRAAAEKLTDLRRVSGVADYAEAMALLEKKRRAAAALEAASRIERENLRDLTGADFDSRLSGLEQTVAAYSPAQPIPANLEEARERLAQAAAARDEAEAALERERAAHAVAAKERGDAQARLREKRIALELAAKSREQAESALAAARAASPDAELTERRQEAAARVEEARKTVADLEQTLAEKNPDKVRALLQSLTGSLASADRQLREAENEQSAVKAELTIRGEEGLYEEWRAAELAEEDARTRLAARRARAEASRLLWEVMREEREKARRAYIEPLKKKIEELGRVVWNSSFRVQMNEEDLSIASRTLDGVTVPFMSLSGGAREQLSLIFRAACAILVSNHSGMPLILDDALGYTDTDRLQLMGAVLARAAEQCQVVIFTCVPERYGSVGDAKVVDLPNG